MARIAPLLEEFDAARDEAIDLTQGPKGTLRVTASNSFGQIALAPLLPKFCEAFPNISIELILSDRQIDLVEERIDLALRHGTLKDSALISRKLMSVDYKLVASPDYLNSGHLIRSPGDLKHHNLLTFPFEGFRDHWVLTKDTETAHIDVSPKLVVSNAAALMQLAMEGAGITLLADWTVERAIEQNHLVEILPDWSVSGSPSDAAIWIVYQSRTFIPSKTRALIDFLSKTAPQPVGSGSAQ